MVKNLLRRLWRSISQPRFVTGLALTMYATSVGLGLALLLVSRLTVVMYFIPGLMLFVGGVVCFVTAWLGVRYWWAPRIESLFLTAILGGLIAASLLELRSLTLTAKDVAYWIEATMLFALSLIGIARWIWIHRRERRRFIEFEKAITSRD